MAALTGTLYIAGAYTAPTADGILDNIQHALEVGLVIQRAARVPVIVPHVAMPPETSWDNAMVVCQQLVLACAGVVLIPGWEASKGACIEKAWAEAAGIPVWTLDEFLRERAA